MSSGFIPFDPSSSSGGGISSMQIAEVDATYLALTSDDVVVAKGTFNVTLPPASSGVKTLSIKSQLGGGTITVVADGSDLIEGQATQILTVGASIVIAPTTTGDWVII